MDLDAERPEAAAAASPAAPLAPKSRTVISPHQFCLVQLPSGGMKIVDLKPGGVVSLGKFGSFAVDGVLGFPFGQTFEVLEGNEVMPIESLTYGGETAEETEAADAAETASADAAETASADAASADAAKTAPVVSGEPATTEGERQSADAEALAEISAAVAAVAAGDEKAASAASAGAASSGAGTVGPASAPTNQNLINIGSRIQSLSADAIDELKRSTQSSVGQRIISQMIAGHASFDKKTALSQQKYLKRKQQKFLRRFTVEYLGGSQLLRYYIERDSSRVLDMSEETMALALSYANVRPGGRYLLVDETGGVFLYAMMERMRGEGTVVVAHDNEHPNHVALRHSNYSAAEIDRVVKPISWLQFYEPANERIDWVEAPAAEVAAMKFSKREQYDRRRHRAAAVNAVLAERERANFDAVVVVSTLHLPTLMPALVECAGGSRPIVVYHHAKESLLEAQHSFGADRRVLAPSIFETRVRPYQTIPGRMHPVMSMRGFGGYVLWATRVFPREGGVTAIGRGLKRRATGDAPAPDAAAESTPTAAAESTPTAAAESTPTAAADSMEVDAA